MSESNTFFFYWELVIINSTYCFSFQPSEKLEMLTKYLRTTYSYCIWCCVKYENKEDMENDCPGDVRADH